MSKKIFILILVVVVSVLLIFLLRQTQRFAHKQNPLYGLAPIQLPHRSIGNIAPIPMLELSGATYHPQRQTVFVVGDEGDIYEIRTDGGLIRKGLLKQTDIEGITVHPETGFLYAVVEGDEEILEIVPQNFKVTRKFRVNRQFEGKELLKKGGMGLEAIVFIPNAFHPEGGTFWVGNQSFSLKQGKEPSVICEVIVPLISSKTTSGADKTKAKIVEGRISRFFSLSIIDISGLAYDLERQCLLVMSDTTNLLQEMTLDGNIRRQYLIPGHDQEGIVIDKMGFMYIAQENGEIIKLEDHRD